MEKQIKEEVKEKVAEMVANGLPEGAGEIIIREGKALEIREPEKVVIKGTIDAPARWLETRWDRLVEKSCHVITNREELTIVLNCNENNYYGTMIIGVLEFSQEYKRFGINSGKSKTNFEMAELIKMNRYLVENKQVAMKLVSDLQNFKAKVDKDIENTNNNRGDRRILINQAVQSNLPEAFNLTIPVFKGTAPETITIEVYVDPNDFSCSLVSAQANELIEEIRNTEINSVLTRIKERCPDIVIIEQ